MAAARLLIAVAGIEACFSSSEQEKADEADPSTEAPKYRTIDVDRFDSQLRAQAVERIKRRRNFYAHVFGSVMLIVREPGPVARRSGF